MFSEVFGDRLKIARKLKEYTLDGLAEDYNKRFAGGLNKATVSRYENGKQEPMISVVFNMSELLGVTSDWLLGKTDSMHSIAESPTIDVKEGDTLSVFDLQNVVPIKTKKAPLLGEIACGEPIFTEGNIEAYIDLEDGINADFAVIAKGDSMIDARILNGDIVFIRQQETVENGEIAAVLIDDETTLKHVYLTNNSVTLVAANTAHPPMVFTPEDYKDIRILGRAIAFQSSLK